MNKQQEALKLALGELQAGKVGNAMQILREALAEQPAQQRPQNCGTGYCSCIECPYEQPAQEPVAWMDRDGDLYKKLPSDYWNPPHTPLYTSPPASKPWQGLTDEDDIDWDGGDLKSLVCAIEAAHGIKGDA